MTISSDALARIRMSMHEYYSPKRVAFSRRFPKLAPLSIGLRQGARMVKNYLKLGSKLKQGTELPFVVEKHSSPLYRKLGTVELRLQENKIKNIKLAIKHLDGLIIDPGEIFSLWHHVGITSKKHGYTSGLTLRSGVPSEGIGGGLCQLSNLLFWMFLHIDVEILERHHHSVDVFPDSGRTIPFGSGATIFSNYLDLCVKNISSHPLQISLRVSDSHVEGRILSDAAAQKKYHIAERNHAFIKHGNDWFRYNELYRDEELVVVNFAPVKYEVTTKYLADLGYEWIEI
ncbi:MAG: VanW family protein [bacterium]